MVMQCSYEGCWHPAVIRAAQSIDQGATKTYRPLCRECMADWQVDSDWEGEYLIAVRDLCCGDMVDLEGDPFADRDDAHPEFESEYQIVAELEAETLSCTCVYFGAFTCGFPPEHLLRLAPNGNAIMNLRCCQTMAHGVANNGSRAMKRDWLLILYIAGLLFMCAWYAKPWVFR